MYDFRSWHKNWYQLMIKPHKHGLRLATVFHYKKIMRKRYLVLKEPRDWIRVVRMDMR